VFTPSVIMGAHTLVIVFLYDYGCADLSYRFSLRVPAPVSFGENDQGIARELS